MIVWTWDSRETPVSTWDFNCSLFPLSICVLNLTKGATVYPNGTLWSTSKAESKCSPCLVKTCAPSEESLQACSFWVCSLVDLINCGSRQSSMQAGFLRKYQLSLGVWECSEVWTFGFTLRMTFALSLLGYFYWHVFDMHPVTRERGGARFPPMYTHSSAVSELMLYSALFKLHNSIAMFCNTEFLVAW